MNDLYMQFSHATKNGLMRWQLRERQKNIENSGFHKNCLNKGSWALNTFLKIFQILRSLEKKTNNGTTWCHARNILSDTAIPVVKPLGKRTSDISLKIT